MKIMNFLNHYPQVSVLPAIAISACCVQFPGKFILVSSSIWQETEFEVNILDKSILIDDFLSPIDDVG